MVLGVADTIESEFDSMRSGLQPYHNAMTSLGKVCRHINPLDSFAENAERPQTHDGQLYNVNVGTDQRPNTWDDLRPFLDTITASCSWTVGFMEIYSDIPTTISSRCTAIPTDVRLSSTRHERYPL